MIVLAGASASGKTEVAKLLSARYGVNKVITTTTRPMRLGEVDGIDYYFVSKERFQEMIDEDDFIEYTIFNENYYGSTKDSIEINKCVVIDPKGLESYLALLDPSIVTFLLISSEETRYERMMNRGDNLEDAQKRIIHDRTAFDEKVLKKEVDYVINSENLNALEVTNRIYEDYHKELKKRHVE